MDRLLKFDYLRAISINKVIEELDEYQRQRKVRGRLNVEEENELRYLAAVQSIGSSTRIEGSKMSDEEVASLIAQLEIRELKTRDEREVAGYHSVLNIIHKMYRDLPVSENIIKGLHNELMKFSSKDEFHRGEYKKHSNQVVATDQEGKQKVIFFTTQPMYTAEEMKKAVNWYNHHIEEGKYHPLMVICAFIYEFLTIHPFQDGNGRLSRLLTNLLLLKQGYDFVEFASLERIIERDKAAYYKALMMSQRHRGTDEEKIGDWTYFLLTAVRELTTRLDADENFVVEEPANLYVNKRQREVMDFIRDEGVLSIGDIDALLPAVSRNTLKYDLGKLTDAGLLIRRGKGRGTVYELKKNSR